MLKPLLLSEVAATLNGRVVGADASFSGVSIDSRAIGQGQLFIALTGPRFDGHDYLNDVAAKGAVAALVEREVPESALPQLVVADTRVALGQLGALNRAGYDKPVAAITGSSGKTTVKEMLACILRTRGPVLATKGNLNNDLGVPLTLLELTREHTSAVIELGASRIGEIAYTVAMTKPHVAVLNNAGTAHVGEFGGPDKIVEAKGEIIEGLEADGIAVLNLDDKAFAIWHARAAGRQVLSFSLKNPEADFYASDMSLDARGCPRFTLHSPQGIEPVQINLLGTHNVANALAAAAAAHALGVSLFGIKTGLEAVQPVKGRAVAQVTGTGLRIIDDTYNANPTSMCAAVDILAAFSGRTVLVLGDIGELGEWAEQGHREVGAYAADKVSALYAVGPLMAHAVAAFGHQARHFANQADLITALRTEHEKNTTILIKGSRSAAMENVVAA
ncbi:UDP-N-acetylmuramoyl-tripeptide--D-alanyl-D-alanine ligase, partial [Pseudomonas helleri]